MIKTKQLTTIFESHAGQAKKAGRNDRDSTMIGLMKMRDEVIESVGVQRDAFGRPSIKSNSAHPTEYDLVETLEAFGEALGFRQFARSVLDKKQNFEFHGSALEAGPGIDPTAFTAISLWTGATAGLVEAQVIEKYQNPAYIGDMLVTVKPTKLNGQKFIGVTGIGNKAQERFPGESHARATFGQHFITTPELSEQALAVEVTQEADFYDLTGQVMETAAGVGEELGYKRELTLLDLVLGVVNPYSYNGTGYNTYQTSSPWINSQQNEMVDYKDIDESSQLFTQMTDPATGKEILVMPNTILHHTARELDFAHQMNVTEVRETTNTNTVTIAPGPIKTRYNRLSSPILDNRMTAANGLNLSTTNAKKRWFHGDPKGAFMWMEAWPLRTNGVSANEYVMRDKGLIAAFFSNYRGVGAVREPRKMVVNTH